MHEYIHDLDPMLLVGFLWRFRTEGGLKSSLVVWYLFFFLKGDLLFTIVLIVMFMDYLNTLEQGSVKSSKSFNIDFVD